MSSEDGKQFAILEVDRIGLGRAFAFEAGHRLEGYDGKCATPHGHSYHGRVMVSVPRAKADANNILMDFDLLKKAINDTIVAPYDHRSLTCSAEDLVFQIAKGLQAWFKIHGGTTLNVLHENLGLKAGVSPPKLKLNALSCTRLPTATLSGGVVATDLNPGAYLALNRFSKTERFVVRPANTTHILIAQMSNGQCYVCIEDLSGTKWSIRPDTSQAFPNRGAAEAFAAGLHRAQTKAQKGLPVQEKKPADLPRVLPVCRECHSNPHTAECSIRKVYDGTTP